MRIAYLLDETAVSGTARLILAQADALVARGHRVRIVTTGLAVTWRSSRAEWIYVDDLEAYAGDDDVVVDDLPPFPIVDEEFFRTPVPRENEPPRVLLSGSSQVEENAIGDGYGAVAHARWFHQTLDLIRVAPYAPSREEPLESVQEFHVALNAREMTRLMHSCDLLVAPQKRFALSTAEALAAGLCVVTVGEPQDFALFAPADNAVELGERLIEALTDGALRARLRTRGREVAEQWRAANVAPRLEEHLSGSSP